ncbi:MULTISPECIES: IS66 family insertion sequence element accessory protein TnpB [Pseudomonas]|nr:MULTISPECIES: IS66 family insertion sequence element accessory protein TnpB [Pseudomonas]MCF1251180.1 IS66 family insertion sequence element accessory protein TnpB [Pseudomonas putida]MCU9233677.1 IS66 family insertion sequence element accessory protein TnpB [Pseudomonas aeruginosa]MDD2028370.1 IS66 family insertion sequence element accessory protein TnpB [Pseudomonas putida]MDM9589414.1 IS66 family insertion sequence element accessory protein TnpB [Pseudomonas asiatica]MDW3716497.1 IS66 fa
MMRPDAKVEKVYLYPKPVDFRKSIDGLAALVELDIKVAVFDPVLFVFLNRHRNRVKILYWGVSRTLASASDAVSKMGVGLPKSACRSWLQTTRCCCVQKAWW